MHERMDSQMSEILIEVKNLDKQYMKQKAVNNANFQIKRGMICGLIGPNGAGKTTIMKMLGGLAIPTGGSISIFGETSENGLAKARSRMSFMIETPYAKEKMNARENLEKQRIGRKADYSKRVFYQPEYAKEIKLTGIEEALMEQYDEAIAEERKMALKYSLRILPPTLINWICVFTLCQFYAVPVYLAYLAIEKKSIQ